MQVCAQRHVDAIKFRLNNSDCTFACDGPCRNGKTISICLPLLKVHLNRIGIALRLSYLVFFAIFPSAPIWGGSWCHAGRPPWHNMWKFVAVNFPEASGAPRSRPCPLKGLTFRHPHIRMGFRFRRRPLHRN